MIGAGIRGRRLGAASVLALGTVMGVAALSAAPAALAAPADDPIPDLDWSDCPELPPGYQAFGSVCVETRTTSGSFTLGGAEHALTKPIKVTVGSAFSPEGGFKDLFGALRSEDFTVDLGPGVGTVRGSLRYAGGLVLRGFDTTLGVKVALTGGGLGGQCTVGSDGDPVMLNLTTGTTSPPPPNQPISGEPFKVVGSIPHASLRKGTQVENSFAIPGATGCGTDGHSANTAVNTALGLPSPAGSNTVILHAYGAGRAYHTLP